MTTMSDTPVSDTVMDADLARRFLALIVQRDAVLNGAARTLDPQIFPKPLDEIAAIVAKLHRRYGEVPSLDTVQRLVAERIAAVKPAHGALLRAQLREFEALAAMAIPDPVTTANQAVADACNCAAARCILAMVDAIASARRRGEPVDLRGHVATLTCPPEPEATDEAIVVTLADVQPEAVRWLWAGRIPRGKLTIIAGDPGAGKSNILLDIAARVSRGAPWPTSGGPCHPGTVLLLTAEDGLADTVRPRLDAMRGDPRRVHALTAIRHPQGERPFNLETDIPRLEAVLAATAEVALVGIDPVSAYWGRGDSWKDTEVRRVLTPLAALAERTGAAVVGIMHLTKDSQRRAIHRVLGSVGFAGAARSLLAVCKDQGDPDRRLFLPVKSNLGVPPPGLAFRLESVQIGEGGSVSRVAWEVGTVNVNADEALSARRTAEEQMAHDDAVEFLRGLLRDGPVPAANVEKAARQMGVPMDSVRRAKRSLGVRATKQGFGLGGTWTWTLPEADGSREYRPLS